VNRGLEVLLLTIGGALGTNARYWLAVWMSSRVNPRFPWATFTINVSGSFAIGLLATLLNRWLPGQSGHPARLFLLVGFLGGYTTFSTFSLESHVLWENHQIRAALAYMAGSLFVGLAAVVLGVALGRAIVGPEKPPILVAITDDVRGVDE
jgi:fluoride exporter